MELVRREVRLPRAFARTDVADALVAFRVHYNVAPERALCAPDVFARIAELIEGRAAAAHEHSTRLRFEGVPVLAAVIAPSTIVVEGHIDHLTLGDW